MSETEQKIIAAMYSIEQLGCDIRLTEAVILLSKAKELVISFEDETTQA